eukprot:g5485.t1
MESDEAQELTRCRKCRMLCGCESIAISILVPSKSNCSGIFTREVWGGCKVPVPFCQELFVAKCDCAVLEMTNYTQKELPESFGGLTSLVKLGVYSGQLEELPQPIGANHKRMIVLMVIGNQLKSLPDSVGNLQNLMGLWVFNNQLTSLPDSLGNLQNLLHLQVFNNQLTSLPDSVENLQNLLHLWVFNNQLTSLPDSLGNLQNLVTFWVFNNQVTSLPDSVGKLHNLLNLIVFNNRLTSLPDSVGNLQNLQLFLVWNNTLTTLPKTVGDMESLIELDLNCRLCLDNKHQEATAGFLYLNCPLCLDCWATQMKAGGWTPDTTPLNVCELLNTFGNNFRIADMEDSKAGHHGLTTFMSGLKLFNFRI